MRLSQIDGVFSKFIRNRYAIEGFNRCFTCGKIDRIENLDCGHFISRKVLATRFNEINCQVQCKTCNQFLSGNLIEFEKKLIEVYGIDEVNYLKSLKYKITKNFDLAGVYANYCKI